MLGRLDVPAAEAVRGRTAIAEAASKSSTKIAASHRIGHKYFLLALTILKALNFFKREKAFLSMNL
jgi:hypothetical protein